MKRFPELARRGVALALAASMSLSVFMPGALAADLTTAEEHDHDHDHVHLAAENSVDALGNEDFSDEVYNVPGDTAFTAADTAADPLGGDDEEEIDLDDLTEEQLAEQAAVDASGHEEHTPDTDAEPVYEQPATCAERGYAIYPCSFTLEQEDGTVAHCYHQVVVWLPLADHEWGEWQEPDDADSQKYRVCTVCNAVEYEDGTVVTPGGIPIVDPDQPEWLPGDIGVGGNYDDQIEATWTPPSWNHTHNYGCSSEEELPYNTTVGQFGSWIQHPTCTSRGKVRKQCINPLPNGWACASTEERWTEKAPHSYGAWIEEAATCTKAGKHYQKCSNCVAEKVDDKYAASHPATGHLSSNGQYWFPNDKATEDKGWQTKDATCGEDGKLYRDCKNCVAEEVKETYPATGKHTPFANLTSADSWHILKKATCTEDGERIQKCSVCGHDIPGTEEVIPKRGHDLEFVKTVKVTCETDGYDLYVCKYDDCKEEVKKNIVTAPGHVLGEYEDDPVLGCAPTEQHTESRYCTVCGAKTNTRPNGKTQQPHRFTHYVLTVEKKSAIEVAIRSRAQCDNVLYNRDGTPALDADGHQIRCSTTDETVISDKTIGDFDKLADELFTKPMATTASEGVAEAVMPIIRKTLNDVKVKVNSASSREEAIAALDELYNAAVAELMKGNRSDGEFHVPFEYDLGNELVVQGLAKLLGKKTKDSIDVHFKITEDMAKSMLKPLNDAMDNVKVMLNNSFLTEDAIKQMVDKLMDTVLEDSSMNKIQDSVGKLAYSPVYKAVGGKYDGNTDTEANQKTVIGSLILQLAQTAVDEDAYWQSFLDAIFDDLIDMLIEQLKKDPEYSKYLNNALGDELLEELRPKLREELVKDDAFVKAIRDVASDAIQNAAARVNAGWSDDQILDKLREDLLKVQDPVEQEMLDLSATIGDLVESSLAEKINKLLPFGDLTSWIGKWVGAFAKDKAVSEVVGETGKVRQTIEMYIKYITCGKHDPQTRIAQQASCTNNEMTERYCSKCGWVFEKYKTGDAWGHTPVTVKGYDATETADGLTDGIQCARCGAWIEPQEVIPAEEPQYEKYLVKSAVTADTVKAAGYKNQKKLDEAIDAALTKAGYQTANSERFLAQVQTSIGILSNDRYPEDGVTGMVKLPAGAAGKNCTFYAVQVLTADTHGYSAGDVVITPLTVTSEGISFKLPVQSVVAIAWKVNE